MQQYHKVYTFKLSRTITTRPGISFGLKSTEESFTVTDNFIN
jgi:hypothetical protein